MSHLDPSLFKTMQGIESMRKLAVERGDVEKPAEPKPAGQLALPLVFGWAVPNFCLRSAVFPAAARCWRLGGAVSSLGSLHVSIGPNDLVQSDSDIFYYALNRSDSSGVARFARGEILRCLGISNGGHNADWVEERLRAMVGVTIDVSQPHRGKQIRFTKPLILGVASDATGRLVVEIHPMIGAFFAVGGAWSTLDFSVRKMLRGKPLALWLHGFFLSHSGEHVCRVSQIRDLAGFSIGSKNFTAALGRACLAVSEAVNASGHIFRFSIVGGVFTGEVVRPPADAAKIFRLLKKHSR